MQCTLDPQAVKPIGWALLSMVDWIGIGRPGEMYTTLTWYSIAQRRVVGISLSRN